LPFWQAGRILASAVKRLLFVIAAVVVAGAVVAVVRRAEAASPPSSPTRPESASKPREQPKLDRRFTIRVTDEMREHSRIGDILYFVEQAWDVGVLLLVLGSGLSRRIADLAARIARKPFLASMLYFALLSVVTTLLWFPLTYYAGFHVPHHFDLTNQTLVAWLADEGKALLVGIVLGAPVAALALFGIRRFRHWWRILWVGSIPVILIGIVIWPLFIDPVFNDFIPLQNAKLKQKLLDEASVAGISGSRVYQVDKSKQTKTMNAYVTGLGVSKRIVLWDTLLAKMSDDEILAVMGHEMGHYVLHHLWKGFAFSLAVSFFTFLLGQRVVEWGIARFGPRWRVASAGDAAALPWLLLVTSLIGFVLSPVISGYSRHTEHQADIFGLELTHFNEASASSFVKFSEDSKQDPYPSRFIEFWRYSHPSLGRRVEFALRYRPWEEGKPNQLWRGSEVKN
jgi:STE24 endopeptidase